MANKQSKYSSKQYPKSSLKIMTLYYSYSITVHSYINIKMKKYEFLGKMQQISKQWIQSTNVSYYTYHNTSTSRTSLNLF